MEAKQRPSRVVEVRARLLDLVERLPVGSALPGERTLAQQWSVARMTLRRAVDELVLDGLLDRRHGSGTYVAQPKVSRPLSLLSFSADLRRRGLETSARVVELRHVRATVKAARQLRIPVGEDVVRLTRLRLVDGIPMCVEALSIPGQLVPGLTRDELTGSWYELLHRRYGIEVLTGSLTIEPVLPTGTDADLLEIPHDQPCLMSTVVTYDRRGRVVEQGTSVARGDRYRLAVDLRPEFGARHEVRRGA